MDAECRQSLRHLAEHFHAAPGEIEVRADHQPADHHDQGDRDAGQKFFPEKQHDQRRAPIASEVGIGFPRVPDEMAADFSQKSPWPPLMPQSFGSCELAR